MMTAERNDHDAPPPAPVRVGVTGPEYRQVAFRVPASWRDALNAYVDEVGSTRQNAGVQMYREYLQRRGLLPDED